MSSDRARAWAGFSRPVVATDFSRWSWCTAALVGSRLQPGFWAAIILTGLCGQTRAAGAERFDPLKTDSRTPYVHRITLYAADGAAIDPQDARAPPYSPQATCGKCHPIAAIRHGWHFNASDPDISGGRPGEPWILVDEKTAAVLPLSGRRWPGTVTPAAAGLTIWQFVKRFGGHMPGGGFGEPSDEELAKSPQRARWEISGRLEIDCMVCHSADQQHDPAELDRQIEAENFKWAPTVALGLGVVRGEARRLPDDWDSQAPPNPDYPDLAGPKLIYDKRHFDLDDRVFFNITCRVPSERCYFCHSFREVGPGAADDMLVSRDVHLAAGLLCVDCHRNEVDHNMVRGYETEAAERKDAWVAAYSCAGCHLGADAATSEPEAPAKDATAASASASEELPPSVSGRYGAPRPAHAGLPPVHFEKLTCTVCHSGPWPELDAKRFQTAMNHGLGLPTRDRDDQQSPRIVGPIFARLPDGKIAPQRMVWTNSPDQPANEAKPYLWALAHDVRPATQALGVHGCTDCHAGDAPIDAGCLTTVDESAQSPSMLAFRGDDADERVVWALAFKFRPAFKYFACTGALLIGLILLRNGLDGLTSLLRRVL
jgi:hypothetical protein